MIKADKDNNSSANSLRDILEENEKLKSLNAKLSEENLLLCEKNKAKSDFLANISHEIRTPLYAVLGFSELILNNKDANPELLENIEYIYKSGEILIDLLNDILDLSKVEAGKMEVHLEHVNIVELIENIHTLSKGNLTQKGLYIKFDLNGIKEILTDKKKLNQILFNLIGNAVKFTDKGGIELNLTQNDKEYCFSVKDSGVGIGFSECKEIFDAYKSSRYQGFTKKISGSGLGLTISRKLIELLNGKIWVESKINEGSTFYFTLPKNNEAKKLKKMA